MSKKYHEMRRVRKVDMYTAEYECPECGRRFVVQFEPEFKKEILEPGDQNVTHAYGGTSMMSIVQPGRETQVYREHPTGPGGLDVFAGWLEQHHPNIGRELDYDA